MSKSAIPSIHYRGPENFVSVIGSYSRVNYIFSQETDYTVTPETWEDFYEIMLLDRVNIAGRLYVCADDPTAKTNLRRVPVEERFVPQEILDNQAEIDAEAEKRNTLKRYKNEYVARINLSLARGELEEIPENLEIDAEKYAEEQYALSIVTEVAPETPVETSAEEVKLPPMTVEAPVEGAPIESQVPVVEDPQTVPVENTTPTVETPVVETTEVLEKTSDIVSETPVTEPTVEAPTSETPVEETPTVEAPIEAPTEVVDTPTEEAPVETTPKKKSSK